MAFGDALQAYAARLGVAEPDLLVAISRKGPRLLQLISELPEIGPLDLSRCVSEKALPFIPRDSLRGTRVLVTDDTIAYGSTFAKNCGRFCDTGAKVTGEVLAMSREANVLAAELLQNRPLVLPEVRIQQLIDLEIQAFGALAVPYDIDHPILTVPFRGGLAELAEQLRRRHPGTQQPSNSWHEAHGVTVLSLPAPETVVGAHSQAGRRLGPQKLRLFLDAERGAVRAVAIFALALHEKELGSPELFVEAPGELPELWRDLLERVEASGWPAKDRHLALANTAHYLAGCEALWHWLAGGDLGIDSASATISEWDLRLLFGPAASADVRPRLQAFLAGASARDRSQSSELPPDSDGRFDAEAEIEAFVATERGRAFMEQAPSYLATAASYDPGDVIHSLFNAQRRVYDEETRGSEGLDVERLKIGLLPFPTVIPLLARLGAEVDEHDLERFADRAIDGGSIVPHYTAALSTPDLWLRSVRAGERGTQKPKHWLHRCALEATRAYERTHKVPGNLRGQGVPWYVSEKLFAVLATTLGSELQLELGTTVACGRDEFGARATLPDLPREPYLLDWATEIGVLERQPEGSVVRHGSKSARGRFVSASPTFRELYPEALDTVDRQLRLVSRTVIDAFIAIDALFEGERRDLAVLALSSCGSHEAYLRSISAEAEVWLTHRHFNALRIASGFHELAGNPGDRRHAIDLSRELQRSATALAQTAIKRNAYRSRVGVRDAIDEACKSNNLMSPHAAAWEEYIRAVVDDSDVDGDRAESYLLHAAELGNKAVSIARTVLTTHGLVTQSKGESHSVAHHVERYQEILASASDAGLNYAQPAVDRDALLSEDAPTALRAAGNMLRDAHQAVEQIWNTWRQPGPPKALVSFEENRAVLIWDVVGSSANPEAAQETIHRVNVRVREELEHRGPAMYTDDQDDGHAVVLPTARDAFEVFQVVAEIFGTDGLCVRGGIETTTDGRVLQQNPQSGHFAGRAYALAARAMGAFGEVADDKASMSGWCDENGVEGDMAPPAGSHLMVTDRTLKQLREREGIDEPNGYRRWGVIIAYTPRVGDSLSTNITCFVPREAGG
jgi:hypothetical protein